MAGQKAGDSAGDAVDAVVARLKGRPARAAARHSVSNLGLAPHTRLNTTLSASRVFASISLPLAQVNAARRRHKATLNDAVLMICSGALRRDFLKHGPLPRKSMVAGVPISTRAKGDTSANTQATMTVVSLGTHIADPAKRLRHVLAATAAMKSNMGAMKNLMPTDFPTLGVPWLMEGLGALYAKARVAERLPAISNLTISNVPGPTVQLYMAGAKMLTNYPTSIVVHGVALNITVQTYNESLEFGIVACGDAMPEVAELARHVQAAFDEFAALPATVEATSTDVPAASVGKVVANQTARKKATRKATKTTPAKATAVTIVGSSTAASNKATPVRSGRSARKVPARSVSQRTRSAASPATPATPASKVSTPTKKRASR
jgi:WS/DGAT/MGAT family acyltransferase